MLCIIKGASRVDYCRVPKRELEKHFLSHRGQLYKMMPDGMLKLHRYTADGEFLGVEAVIVYDENATEPYHHRSVDYRNDSTLMDIDEHKLMSPRRLWGGKAAAYFRAMREGWGQIAAFIPLAVGGIVLLYAFLLG